MTVAELIKALRAMPQDAAVILADAAIDRDEPGHSIETYAKVAEVVVRHAAEADVYYLDWDITPAVESWPGSAPVVLLKSAFFDRDEHHAPTTNGVIRTYSPVSRA